jgi:hypothetical protein
MTYLSARLTMDLFFLSLIPCILKNFLTLHSELLNTYAQSPRIVYIPLQHLRNFSLEDELVLNGTNRSQRCNEKQGRGNPPDSKSVGILLSGSSQEQGENNPMEGKIQTSKGEYLFLVNLNP